MSGVIRGPGGSADQPGRSGAREHVDPVVHLRQTWSLLVLVLCALFFGGGGADTPPLLTMAVELLALVVLAMLALRPRVMRADPRARPAIAFALLLALAIMVQLIPLPPWIWSALPGREISTLSRGMLDLSDRWFPLSLDPERTRAVGCQLAPAIAVFLGTLYSSEADRRRLMKAVAAIASLDLLLGVLQFASNGQASFVPWGADTNAAVGLFANRNHNADFLLIAPLMFAALLRLEGGHRLGELTRSAAIVAYAVFSLGVLITYSRTGVTLTVIPLIGVVALFTSRGSLGTLRPGSIALLCVGLLVVAAAAIAFAPDNPVILGFIGRFDAMHDQRLDFWPDVIYAIRQLWPFGSGSGTFDPVFRSVEQLDTLGPRFANHAHNDYMELLMELGLGGALLIVGALALYVRMVADLFFGRRGRPLNCSATAAVFSLAILLLHSLVDYPMRTLALGTLAGLLAGLTFAPVRIAGGRGTQRRQTAAVQNSERAAAGSRVDLSYRSTPVPI